jgi:insertion element IS1 protein InsB
LALRIEAKYKIEIMATDGYSAYSKYKIATNHIITKAETALVESKNSLLRHFLARFNRRTKRFSKTIDMINNSILLLFNKKLLISIFN